MHHTLEKYGKNRQHSYTIIRITQFPKHLVQIWISYLYTGIMEKPEESECALFTQLLAEYDIVPCYTLNPRDLEIIGKMHNIKEEVRSISNNPLDLIIKIKQEVDDSSNGGYLD